MIVDPQPGVAGAAPPPATSLLSVEDLHVEFGPVGRPARAVRGVSFELTPARTLVLLGESGSGKSVTARSLLGLHDGAARTRGEIRFGSTILGGASEDELRSIRGRRIALVPQDANAALDPLRTIGSQVAEVLRHHRVVNTRAEARRRSVDLLRRVGIPDPARISRALPHQLSGGMRQRAAIAIAISCEPEVLIADEPTTALDLTVQAQILELFEELQDELSMAILLVTHDVGVAEQVGDTVAVMYAGRIVEIGPAPAVLERPAHPYTAALLAALPSAGTRRGQLMPIPGRAVLAGEAFSGCPFAPRCRVVTPASRAAEPDLAAIEPGRAVACVAPLIGLRPGRLEV